LAMALRTPMVARSTRTVVPMLRMAPRVSRPVFARQFSSKLEPKGTGAFVIQVPKNVYGEPGVQAIALYDTIKKAGTDSYAALEELEKLRLFIKKDKTALLDRISNPLLKAPQRTELIQQGVAPLGLSASVSDFATKLGLQKNGFDQLKDIQDFLGQLVRYDRAEILCTVTAVQALSPDQLSKLTAKLKRIVGDELTPVITTSIDPKVLGGMLVTVGDKFQDLTVSSQITKLQKLVEASV